MGQYLMSSVVQGDKVDRQLPAFAVFATQFQSRAKLHRSYSLLVIKRIRRG